MRYAGLVRPGSEQVKELSKAFFGNRHQLEIACAIANEESGIFTATSLSKVTGVPNNLVRPILMKFEKAGTIVLVPKVPGSVSKFYSRVECDFWEACVSIHNSIGSGRGRSALDRTDI
jgi:hypothetical protein